MPPERRTGYLPSENRTRGPCVQTLDFFFSTVRTRSRMSSAGLNDSGMHRDQSHVYPFSNATMGSASRLYFPPTGTSNASNIWSDLSFKCRFSSPACFLSDAIRRFPAGSLPIRVDAHLPGWTTPSVPQKRRGKEPSAPPELDRADLSHCFARIYRSGAMKANHRNCRTKWSSKKMKRR